MPFHRQCLNAFKVGHCDGVIESTPLELIVVLSTGIGNGPTVVICTLINPLPKIRVDYSCINIHSIQFLSIHFCDFYSLPLNRQALVHCIPNTHTHKKIIKYHTWSSKFHIGSLSNTEQLAQACLQHGKLHDFTNCWHDQYLL